jgi:hypothetical protein
MSELPPCIYCGSAEPPREKREHVLPQSYGLFEDNWVLDCVCDSCNQYFGDKLELKGYLEDTIAKGNNISFAAEMTFDIIVQRAIAKIALNYAAKVHGADFVRNSSFDPTRRFIRHADVPTGYQVTTPTFKPILADDTSDATADERPPAHPRVGQESISRVRSGQPIQRDHVRREVLSLLFGGVARCRRRSLVRSL